VNRREVIPTFEPVIEEAPGTGSYWYGHRCGWDFDTLNRVLGRSTVRVGDKVACTQCGVTYVYVPGSKRWLRHPSWPAGWVCHTP
jgi:hypothetical protein